LEEKERLDVLIYRQGLSASREKASSQIMSGIVYVNGVKVDKPGTKLSVNSKIEIRGAALPYVSRGGLKLEKALREFGLQLQDKVAMDIGASTGGFTDCMLQNGATKVYAIDVGYGQLAWSLRTDSRVVCMERTNIRYVTPEAIGEYADFASIDVSFISLKKVLPAVKQLLKKNGEIICLIKPQFEAGREKVGKKGVVRDKQVHIDVIESIVEYCKKEMELSVLGLSYSPIKGPEGNIEYLLYLSLYKAMEAEAIEIDINRIVSEAHGLL
jgi:23S rRNA (cytidine1920-2'-O)/16S rRNA (cytidine1409-2'-O)-methyltransferase